MFRYKVNYIKDYYANSGLVTFYILANNIAEVRERMKEQNINRILNITRTGNILYPKQLIS